MIVQVESVRGQRYARGTLTCSLLICVFLLWAFLHSNKAVSAENLINFRGSSVANTKRPVHRHLASQYSANYMQILRFLFHESRYHKCSRSHQVVSAHLTTNATFSTKKWRANGWWLFPRASSPLPHLPPWGREKKGERGGYLRGNNINKDNKTTTKRKTNNTKQNKENKQTKQTKQGKKTTTKTNKHEYKYKQNTQNKQTSK